MLSFQQNEILLPRQAGEWCGVRAFSTVFVDGTDRVGVARMLLEAEILITVHPIGEAVMDFRCDVGDERAIAPEFKMVEVGRRVESPL